MLYRHRLKCYTIPEVNDMELRVLNYFLMVAKEESISGAANVLHLSQPTLSRQLKDMEFELGKQLFIRGSKKIELTDEGRILKKRAEEIIALVEKTENEITVFAGLHPSREILCGHNDHRIVMAMSILLTRTGGTIDGAEAVSKSLPDFIERMKKLGVPVTFD